MPGHRNSFEGVFLILHDISGVIKRAVKWTSTSIDSVDRLKKCSLIDVDLEKCINAKSTKKVQNFEKLKIFIISKCSYKFGWHWPVEEWRLHFPTGQLWQSMSTAAFFLVDGKQPFSSRPYFINLREYSYSQFCFRLQLLDQRPLKLSLSRPRFESPKSNQF